MCACDQGGRGRSKTRKMSEAAMSSSNDAMLAAAAAAVRAQQLKVLIANFPVYLDLTLTMMHR